MSLADRWRTRGESWPFADEPVRIERALIEGDEVARLIAETPRSGCEVSLALYPPEIGAAALGLSQAIGYLEALEALGRASSELRGGVRRYAAR